MALQKTYMEELAERFRSDLGLKTSDPLDPFELEIEGLTLIPISKVTDFDAALLKRLTGDSANQWSAMSVPLDAGQEKWLVVFNDVHDEERQRVSVMEEVWHILQGHKLTKIVKLGQHYGRTFEADEEHDAYYIASACLVPLKAIQDFVKKAGKQSVQDFAKQYLISKELVEYRIKRLGYWYQYRERKVGLRASI